MILNSLLTVQRISVYHFNAFFRILLDTHHRSPIVYTGSGRYIWSVLPVVFFVVVKIKWPCNLLIWHVLSEILREMGKSKYVWWTFLNANYLWFYYLKWLLFVMNIWFDSIDLFHVERMLHRMRTHSHWRKTVKGYPCITYVIDFEVLISLLSFPVHTFTYSLHQLISPVIPGSFPFFTRMYSGDTWTCNLQIYTLKKKLLTLCQHAIHWYKHFCL